VTTGYPSVRLSDMTLAPATRAQLDRVVHEQRQRALLASRGFAPVRRLLLTGPPGTGKSMTASALATELSLPLVTIRIDALISKYTGEVAVKLRVLFDAMASGRAVCLFDDFDAIGARQVAGYETDIVEARRVLNAFLWFLDDTQPDSLIVTVTGHLSSLDDALLRRFEAVVPYVLPDSAQAVGLLRQRLAGLDTSAIAWNAVASQVKGLSPARLVRAAESAAKRALLNERDSVSTDVLVSALDEFRRARRLAGFSGSRLPGTR
jgi:AAA+ superfamily predicted ATPase